tara:strand:- start:59 stop:286 length:228 start_codon:yes stop_codon:yes gene_type:complete
VPVFDYRLKLALQIYSLSDTFLTADLLLKINHPLIMFIPILSWCVMLAITPLSIGLIAYCSSRPHLSRLNKKQTS